ncbi:protein RRNAD1 [Trichonephila inaurata madagascariensis]|uniref:Protein RRNAD1 n=1 Tax=Trichonephila inaurata madagascariensis TaxID=2747483 RepID=A0A8X6X4J6_9ARAC|nr:protein RRNAD1 [Trichonephila inaurata madagascariensis]GFY54525.1 protein RRNAD1 [Trichonephila inaurata madagascariensis]
MEPKNCILICNDETIEQVKRYATMCHDFLRKSTCFTEAFILDYFVERLWTKYPPGWLEIVSNFDVDDLQSFLDSEKPVRCESPWPLSLLAFRASSFALTLPRKSIRSADAVKYFLEKNFNPEYNKASDDSLPMKSEWSLATNEFEKSGQHKSIPEYCRRHVKPKKQHEIFRMAQVCDVVYKYFDLKNVIDVGSGQGHLSRFLALCCDLRVATMEADKRLIQDAAKFDKQALARLQRKRKYKDDDDEDEDDTKPLPHHCEASVTVDSFHEYLGNVMDQGWSVEVNEKIQFALLGLHTCGNLGEALLKAFVKSEQSKVLFSVGCCYNQLEHDEEYEGFPLSNFVKTLNHDMSDEAREMACHAVEMQIKRLQDNAPSLKIHCYRATLEKVIASAVPHMRYLGLGGVRHGELLPFPVYAERVLSRTNVVRIRPDLLLTPETVECLEKWKDVLIFYILRLMTAPVVESLILIDRLIYLYEQGHPGCIVPIFDPSLSPRNHLIIAARNHH